MWRFWLERLGGGWSAGLASDVCDRSAGLFASHALDYLWDRSVGLFASHPQDYPPPAARQQVNVLWRCWVAEEVGPTATAARDMTRLRALPIMLSRTKLLIARASSSTVALRPPLMGELCPAMVASRHKAAQSPRLLNESFPSWAARLRTIKPCLFRLPHVSNKALPSDPASLVTVSADQILLARGESL